MSCGSQSLSNTVSDPNKKMFGICLHVMNEMHTRFPDLQQADMGVVWFGAGLQGQLPVILLLHPEVEFQIHSHRPCPMSTDVCGSLNVTYHDTSLDECLRHIEEYQGGKKFAVLLDLDYHLKPSQLDAFNRARIEPSVESESVHYDRYTKQYNAACARVARCSHVVLVSTPFRMPWITSDYAANAHKASWADPLLREHEIRVPNMLLFPQFGSRVRSTELRGLLVTADKQFESVIDWKALDKSLNGCNTAARELTRAQFMLSQLETYRTVARARRKADSTDNGCMRTWADAFISNSIDEMHRLV